MDKSIMELLEEVSGADLLFAIFLVIAVSVLVISQKEKLLKQLNKWRKVKNSEEDFKNLVFSLKDSVTELQKAMDEYQENREHDRKDSIRIREEMYEVIGKQSEGIEELTKIVVKMEERNSKTKRAEIKEKIERIYSECHPTMTCTDMALETLKDLIEEYEEHGGLNSFVHTTVVPEMYLWHIVHMVKGESHSE